MTAEHNVPPRQSGVDYARGRLEAHRRMCKLPLIYEVVRENGLSGVSVTVHRTGASYPLHRSGWAWSDVDLAGRRALLKLQRDEEREERVLAEAYRLTLQGPDGPR